MGANEDQVNSSPWKDALDSGTVAEGVPSGKAKGEAVNGKELGEVRL